MEQVAQASQPGTFPAPANDTTIAAVLAAPGNHAEVTVSFAQLLHRNVTMPLPPLGSGDIIDDQRVGLSVLLLLESGFDLEQLEREVAELSLRPGSSSNGFALATQSILRWRRESLAREHRHVG